MEESITLLTKIKEAFACEGQDVRAYSPLTLAYIGDGIYELVIRSVVVERANRSANDLHKKDDTLCKGTGAVCHDRGTASGTDGGRGSGVPKRTQRQIIHHREKTLPWQITAELPVLKH